MPYPLLSSATVESVGLHVPAPASSAAAMVAASGDVGGVLTKERHAADGLFGDDENDVRGRRLGADDVVQSDERGEDGPAAGRLSASATEGRSVFVLLRGLRRTTAKQTPIASQRPARSVGRKKHTSLLTEMLGMRDSRCS